MSKKKEHSTKLGQFFATAICGNDILSSALYVSGIAAVFAGVYAPLVLLAVAVVLFFYRTVYREVVEALPINGGAYNALLNGTSKTIAATAGVMTILSYVATSVISAKTAVEYLFKFLEQLLRNTNNSILADQLPTIVIPIVILVLLIFAIIVISGVKDSAKVATVIFVFHIFTLISFIVFGFIFIINSDGSIYQLNLIKTFASHDNGGIIAQHGGLLQTLFLAFSACLLGVSGFESSANFVEEQKKEVFKKTLRNMLIGVAIFNPIIAFVVLNLLSPSAIANTKDFILAEAALKVGGILLLAWIAINAFTVLCGAVLTSYVGVSGLIKRMSLDNCLPTFLAKENRNGSHPRIIIGFFLLCLSILLLTGGDLFSLAGVYTISFLGVMSLFAAGNIVLRKTRKDLKRPYHAPLVFVIIALLATLGGIIGNSIIEVRYDFYFLGYFIPAIALVYGIIYKKDVIRFLMKYTKSFKGIHKQLQYAYLRTINNKFYVFIHHANRLHKTLDYINRNENSWNVTLIHCRDNEGQREKIQSLIPTLKESGTFPEFKLDFEYLDEEFGPDVVYRYAKKRRINANKIFIGSIHDTHLFDYADLGGVRIIS